MQNNSPELGEGETSFLHITLNPKLENKTNEIVDRYFPNVSPLPFIAKEVQVYPSERLLIPSIMFGVGLIKFVDD